MPSQDSFHSSQYWGQNVYPHLSNQGWWSRQRISSSVKSSGWSSGRSRSPIVIVMCSGRTWGVNCNQLSMLLGAVQRKQ
jgi:hypothetical protein